jgi:hypothetical protein
MQKVSVAGLLLAFFVSSVFSQAPNLCGTVTDATTGLPLADAIVRLGQTTYNNGFGQAPYLVSTDANGHYQLGTGTCNVNVIPRSLLARGDAFSQPTYVGGKVLFSLPQTTATVRMSIYTVAGRFVRDVMNSSLSKGNYSVSIDARGISSQYYLLRVTINGAATVMRIQPAFHSTDGAIVRNSSEFQTRVEKLAAVVDTIHATMPGYAIGVTPITALSGQFDFVLTKNTTWNGDTNAFWGSGYPVATGGVTYVVLNRTNGVWADSQIYWSIQQNGTKTRLDKQSSVTVTGGGRFYIYIDPNDSNARYFDFVEYAVGNGTINGNNTTRVDGWRLPLQYRIHTATKDYTRGDVYEMFYQPRQAKFDEFKNEVPREFTGLATHDFANIWAPHTSPVNIFGTGGPYENYFIAYEDSVAAHNPGAPAPTTTVGIFECGNGGMGSSPDYSACVNRHCGTLPQSAWPDSTNYYRAYPCNYYSKWCHKRALQNLQYGFPYDDDENQSGIVGGVSNVQWFGIAIGW